MQFGLYAPIPMATLASAQVAIAGASRRAASPQAVAG
jgi:hypothetical protein